LQALVVHRRSLLLLFGLLAVVVVLYWPAPTVQGVFFVGDIYRLGYPARHEYALALQQGRIPLWTPHALAGYPTLAEGQTGAYYPVNLLLYRFLPLPAALNFSIIVAFWIAGAGAFIYGRSLGLRRLPAFLAGCTFMLGGFLPGHLNHLNMLAAVGWLPLLLWAAEQATRQPGWSRWAVVGIFFGLQGLAGHPQISLLSALLIAAQTAVGPLVGAAEGFNVGRQVRQLAMCGAALLLGAALAGVQWGPTYELTRMSQRGRGLDPEFFTSFSLHPLHFITMLWPFIRGNPYPLTSLETIGYVGALPLVFAIIAPLRRRDRAVAFWGGVAVVAFLLALGRWNPAYHWLMYVPIFNMFRAPARYLLWLDLAISVLAAVSADSLLSLTRERAGAKGLLWSASGLALLGLGGLWMSGASLDGLVANWRLMPVAWLAGTSALLLALLWRPPARLWSALVVGLLLADLSAFNGVYNQTYNAVMPADEFRRSPDVLRFLQQDAGVEPYRVYTSEEITPILPVMRESLYPNIQLLHGVESLNAYYPLVPAPQRWLLGNVNPRLVDLLNVRYVLIPQLLPVDDAAEAYDTKDPFAPSIVGRAFDLPAPRVAALEIEGYLSHSAEVTDGTPVGEVVLRGTRGEVVIWTLRAGVDLAEWAYRRDDVQKVVRHSLPASVVRTWPARSGFPARDHVGLTFAAHQALPEPMDLQQLEVRPLIPAGFLHLERLRLIDPQGKAELLSKLIGEGDHVLVYRSDDVAIYRNEGAGPRAFLVHKARRVGSEEEAQQLVAAASFQPHREAILADGEELDGDPVPGDVVVIEAYQAEYVRLRAMTAAEGYLVLSDSYYPGWTARVDGRPVGIRRADIALRAVAVPPGEHVVEFSFAPLSWRLGLVVSGVAWLAVAAIGLTWLGRAVGRGR